MVAATTMLVMITDCAVAKTEERAHRLVVGFESFFQPAKHAEY